MPNSICIKTGKILHFLLNVCKRHIVWYMISVYVRTNTQTLEGMVYVKFWIYSFKWVLRSYVNNIIIIVFFVNIFKKIYHKKWKFLIDSFRRITRSFLGTYISLHNFITWFLMNKMHTYLEVNKYNCAQI